MGRLAHPLLTIRRTGNPMQPNLQELLSSASALAVGASEPVVLLVLGGLFLLLSFTRARVRRTRREQAPAQTVPTRSIPEGAPLTAQQH